MNRYMYEGPNITKKMSLFISTYIGFYFIQKTLQRGIVHKSSGKKLAALILISKKKKFIILLTKFTRKIYTNI